MGLFRMFGAGEKRLLAGGCVTRGTVTKVHTCWYIKVNTKAARLGPLDGAAFPHIISFRYSADGREYTGRRCVSWSVRCPEIGEQITVRYDRERPERYAVKTDFGPRPAGRG